MSTLLWIVEIHPACCLLIINSYFWPSVLHPHCILAIMTNSTPTFIKVADFWARQFACFLSCIAHQHPSFTMQLCVASGFWHASSSMGLFRLREDLSTLLSWVSLFPKDNRGLIFGLWTCHQYVEDIVAAIASGYILNNIITSAVAADLADLDDPSIKGN